MRVEIKFCGMTRPEDVRSGAALNARYVGVIFAGGPRTLTVARAMQVLAVAKESGNGPRTVGVFGDAPADEIRGAAERLQLDAVQLHGAMDARVVEKLRRALPAEIWAVVRVEGASLPATTKDFFQLADAVVLDAKVPGQLGGTGISLPWEQLALPLEALRGATRLVLAGGLRPENVGEAIRLLRPDVVDVSSGVETAPGIKDPARMRAFRDAVLGSE